MGSQVKENNPAGMSGKVLAPDTNVLYKMQWEKWQARSG